MISIITFELAAEFVHMQHYSVGFHSELRLLSSNLINKNILK